MLFTWLYIYALSVLAKWIIVKCRTTRWLFVNLCCFPCKDKCDLFWRCFQFTPYPCGMPSNPKRCMSLRGILMNSGDMVWHHFATTKMPTRMAEAASDSMWQIAKLHFLSWNFSLFQVQKKSLRFHFERCPASLNQTGIAVALKRRCKGR